MPAGLPRPGYEISFIKNMHKLVYYLYLIPMFVSAIASLKAFRLGWPLPLRFFSVFLITTLAVEILANCWKFWMHSTGYWSFSENNLWIYNYYLVPQYVFYFYFFKQFLKPGLLHNTIWVLAVLYVLFSMANLLFIQKALAINYFTIIAASFIVVILTTAYIRQLITDDNILQLKKQPLVWISVGALIFHAGVLPYFIYSNSLNNSNIGLSLLLFYIVLVLNILMYTLYAIAFLCTKKYHT